MLTSSSSELELIGLVTSVQLNEHDGLHTAEQLTLKVCPSSTIPFEGGVNVGISGPSNENAYYSYTHL